MASPIRIAILETDTPSPDFQLQFGSFGDSFIRLLQAGSMTLSPPLPPDALIFSKWDVQNPDYYPDIEELDAIVICGIQDLLGPHATDSTPWILKLTDFIRKVLMEQDRVRVIGVNFGHLVIARALGCAIDRLPAGVWECSITTVELGEDSRKVIGRDNLNINQLHRDHVVTLPVNPFPQLPSATLDMLGSTDQSAVQGLYTPRKVMTLQGNPEIDQGMMMKLVAERVAARYFRPDFGNDAVRRSGFRNDGVYIGATFLRFLLE